MQLYPPTSAIQPISILVTKINTTWILSVRKQNWAKTSLFKLACWDSVFSKQNSGLFYHFTAKYAFNMILDEHEKPMI